MTGALPITPPSPLLQWTRLRREAAEKNLWSPHRSWLQHTWVVALSPCIFSLLLLLPLMSSDKKPHCCVQTADRNYMEGGSQIVGAVHSGPGRKLVMCGLMQRCIFFCLSCSLDSEPSSVQSVGTSMQYSACVYAAHCAWVAGGCCEVDCFSIFRKIA
ncbi:uncharacterized protein LOC119322598 isoform X1 [Triticum dicoccoides]|uniref:uncharacterized protein LOC119322598 isoform X1 n=1 Tax=Triticum dicoccoides TaxID=85692 RepID=UPI001890A139|nr:uncharacterized protein LOC119322598 isoform X1 [Triticum dicoccoides]